MRAYHSFEFPLFGYASCRVNAAVDILFSRAPSLAEWDAIRAGVPEPVADTVVLDEEYLGVESSADLPWQLSKRYDALGPSPDHAQRFNGELERWLTRTHRVCPIVAAIRTDDIDPPTDNGATDRSWHEWSVHCLPDLWPRLAPWLASAARDDIGDWCDMPMQTDIVFRLVHLAWDMGVFVPDHIADRVLPGARAWRRLEQGDQLGAAALLAKLDGPAIDEAVRWFVDGDTAKLATLAHVGQAWLSQDELSPSARRRIFEAAVRCEGEAALALRSRLGDEISGDEWFEYSALSQAHDWLEEGRMDDARTLLDVIVDARGPRHSRLHVLEAILHGPHTDELGDERIDRLAEHALTLCRHRWLALFWEACIRARRGDHEGALDELEELHREFPIADVSRLSSAWMLSPLRESDRWRALMQRVQEAWVEFDTAVAAKAADRRREER